VRQRIRAIRQNENGFTLIELLIVIIILGVLAGVVVLAVNGISDRGVNAACKADKKTIEVAVEAYYAKNTGFPLPAVAETTDHRLDELIAKGFLKDKPTNTDYTITISEKGVVGPVTCP
jgi:general secretion pathway protein G